MDIHDYIIAHFNQLPTKKDQNTVLAAFLVRNRLTQELTVCSMATGTKSLPYILIKQHPRQLVRDMHAEVLAQRAFKRFLLKENFTLQNLFIEDVKRNKLGFNYKLYELIFYTSQPPCGDCCIQKKGQLYSGARPLIHFLNKDIDDEEKYRKCVLRTKPSRLDLPVEKRSLSLCCSDKIMLWNVLGVQGSKLFSRYKPIYVNKVVVEKEENLQQSTVSRGLSLVERIKSLRNYDQSQIAAKLFKLNINGKMRFFTRQFKCHQPEIIFLSKKFSKQKGEGSDTSLVYNLGQKVQQINGRTGLLQGASLKQLQKGKGISSYSSIKLTDPILKEEQKYQYRAVKENIKQLFGIWKDRFS